MGSVTDSLATICPWTTEAPQLKCKLPPHTFLHPICPCKDRGIFRHKAISLFSGVLGLDIGLHESVPQTCWAVSPALVCPQVSSPHRLCGVRQVLQLSDPGTVPGWPCRGSAAALGRPPVRPEGPAVHSWTAGWLSLPGLCTSKMPCDASFCGRACQKRGSARAWQILGRGFFQRSGAFRARVACASASACLAVWLSCHFALARDFIALENVSHILSKSHTAVMSHIFEDFSFMLPSHIPFLLPTLCDYQPLLPINFPSPKLMVGDPPPTWLVGVREEEFVIAMGYSEGV